MGTGSVTFKQALTALVQSANEELRKQGQGSDPLEVPAAITVAACDYDKHAQEVLASLPEVFRPEHIHGDLNERLAEKCLKQLDEARETTFFELQTVLSEEGAETAEDRKRIEATYGMRLLDRYMLILENKSFWKTDSGAGASVPAKAAEKKSSPGRQAQAAQAHGCKSDDIDMPPSTTAAADSKPQPRVVKVAVGGSVCVDHSPFGADIILHENSSRFLDWIFPLYLPEYKWFTVQLPITGTSDLRNVMLSPWHFGWPERRPRLYTVGIRQQGPFSLQSHPCIALAGAGKADGWNFENPLNKVIDLWSTPNFEASEFFAADEDGLTDATGPSPACPPQPPQEQVEAERRTASRKTCRDRRSSFEMLLTGAKPTYLRRFKELEKVKKLHSKGYTVIANLAQNPDKRPEHLIAMGVPVYADLAGLPLQPHFEMTLGAEALWLVLSGLQAGKLPTCVAGQWIKVVGPESESGVEGAYPDGSDSDPKLQRFETTCSVPACPTVVIRGLKDKLMAMEKEQPEAFLELLEDFSTKPAADLGSWSLGWDYLDLWSTKLGMAADFAKADQQQQPQQQDNPLGEALDKFAGFAEPVTPLKTQVEERTPDGSDPSLILCERHSSGRAAMLKQEKLVAMEKDEPEAFMELLEDFCTKLLGSIELLLPSAELSLLPSPNPGRGKARAVYDFSKVKSRIAVGKRKEDSAIRKPFTQDEYILWFTEKCPRYLRLSEEAAEARWKKDLRDPTVRRDQVKANNKDGSDAGLEEAVHQEQEVSRKQPTEKQEAELDGVRKQLLEDFDLEDDAGVPLTSRRSTSASAASGGSNSATPSGSGRNVSSGANSKPGNALIPIPLDKKEQALLKLMPAACATRLRSQTVKEFTSTEAMLVKALNVAASVEKQANEIYIGTQDAQGDPTFLHLDPSLQLLRSRVAIAKQMRTDDPFLNSEKAQDIKRQLMQALMEDPFFRESEEPKVSEEICLTFGQLKYFREVKSKLLSSTAAVIEKFGQHRSALLLMTAVAKSIICEADSWRATVAAESKAVEEERRAKEKEDKKRKTEEDKQAKKERGWAALGELRDAAEKLRKKEEDKANKAKGGGRGDPNEEADADAEGRKAKKRRGPKMDRITDEDPQILQTGKNIKEMDVSESVDDLCTAMSCNEPFACRLKKGPIAKVLRNAKAHDGSSAAPPKETVTGFTKVVTTAALKHFKLQGIVQWFSAQNGADLETMRSLRHLYSIPGDTMYVPPGSIIVEKAMGSTFTVKAHTCIVDLHTRGCLEELITTFPELLICRNSVLRHLLNALAELKLPSPHMHTNGDDDAQAKAKAGDAQGQGREDAVPAEESQDPTEPDHEKQQETVEQESSEVPKELEHESEEEHPKPTEDPTEQPDHEKQQEAAEKESSEAPNPSEQPEHENHEKKPKPTE
ncbi:unnamed protein product, partial [Symbiodinium sp. KB8]